VEPDIKHRIGRGTDRLKVAGSLQRLTGVLCVFINSIDLARTAHSGKAQRFLWATGILEMRETSFLFHGLLLRSPIVYQCCVINRS